MFNSAYKNEHTRNTCNHPNLNVESKFADITIAICSEFRSKKDYSFESPNELVELKTGNKIEVTGAPDPTLSNTETITTKELEQSVSDETTVKEITPEAKDIPLDQKIEQPFIVDEREVKEQQLYETYRLTSDTSTNFLVLRRVYQSYLKSGIIISVIVHIIALWLLFALIVKKEDSEEHKDSQRIVIVEDIETPKFDPPELDKKEEKTDEDKVADNNVRPKIQPKVISPKIKRPLDNQTKDTSTVRNTLDDSTKRRLDSLLALKKLDTNRYVIPDSLRTSFSENEVGMSIDFPKEGWALIDTRKFQPEKPFEGVMLGLDSLAADPKAINIRILIDNPKYNTFNKGTYKNVFEMNDSTYTAYATDPMATGENRINLKYFIFIDQTGSRNIAVNAEVKKDYMEKYKPIIDAIIRSIRIVKKPAGDGQ